MEKRERAGAGAVGSAGSLGLRVGQAVFSSASLLFTSVGVEFFSYTAFCFLVTIMGLVIPWSCTLAMIDMYSIFVGRPLRVSVVMVIVVVGDWLCYVHLVIPFSFILSYLFYPRLVYPNLFGTKGFVVVRDGARKST